MALVLWLMASPALAQTGQPGPVIDRPLAGWLLDLDRPGADSMGKFGAAADRRDAFGHLLRLVVAEDWTAARQGAARLGYKLARIGEKGRTFHAVFPATADAGDPAIVINPAARAELIAGVPHPLFEKGTIELAALMVSEIGARAVIVAGAHRCASGAAVACDGRTRACGARGPYRTSDVAHSPDTLFHAAHDTLGAIWPKAVVVSLHGMRNDNDGVETSVVISDGARMPDTEKASAATRFRFALAGVFAQPGAVVSCNHGPDRSFEFRRLCGLTNVQGRAVNGDDDICRRGVTQGTGRFIHVEHARALRQRFENGWRDPKSDRLIRGYLDAVRSVVPSIR